jgi:hypothetical protein
MALFIRLKESECIERKGETARGNLGAQNSPLTRAALPYVRKGQKTDIRMMNHPPYALPEKNGEKCSRKTRAVSRPKQMKLLSLQSAQRREKSLP